MPKITVRFKRSKTAKEFAVNFSILDDDAKVTVSGKTATVVSDNPATVSAAKHMARQVIEDARHADIVGGMVSAIRKSISERSAVSVRLLNGDSQTITTAHGEALARTFDRLSESNQAAFLILAAEDREGFPHAVGFARSNEEN